MLGLGIKRFVIKENKINSIIKFPFNLCSYQNKYKESCYKKSKIKLPK